MQFPDHLLNLVLFHNKHLEYDSTVDNEVWCKRQGFTDWVSEEQKQKAIETNDCWLIRWHPKDQTRYTTIASGYEWLAAHDLEALLKAANQFKK